MGLKVGDYDIDAFDKRVRQYLHHDSKALRDFAAFVDLLKRSHSDSYQVKLLNQKLSDSESAQQKLSRIVEGLSSENHELRRENETLKQQQTESNKGKLSQKKRGDELQKELERLGTSVELLVGLDSEGRLHETDAERTEREETLRRQLMLTVRGFTKMEHEKSRLQAAVRYHETLSNALEKQIGILNSNSGKLKSVEEIKEGIIRTSLSTPSKTDFVVTHKRDSDPFERIARQSIIPELVDQLQDSPDQSSSTKQSSEENSMFGIPGFIPILNSEILPSFRKFLSLLIVTKGEDLTDHLQNALPAETHLLALKLLGKEFYGWAKRTDRFKLILTNMVDLIQPDRTTSHFFDLCNSITQSVFCRKVNLWILDPSRNVLRLVGTASRVPSNESIRSPTTLSLSDSEHPVVKVFNEVHRRVQEEAKRLKLLASIGSTTAVTKKPSFGRLDSSCFEDILPASTTSDQQNTDNLNNEEEETSSASTKQNSKQSLDYAHTRCMSVVMDPKRPRVALGLIEAVDKESAGNFDAEDDFELGLWSRVTGTISVRLNFKKRFDWWIYRMTVLEEFTRQIISNREKPKTIFASFLEAMRCMFHAVQTRLHICFGDYTAEIVLKPNNQRLELVDSPAFVGEVGKAVKTKVYNRLAQNPEIRMAPLDSMFDIAVPNHKYWELQTIPIIDNRCVNAVVQFAWWRVEDQQLSDSERQLDIMAGIEKPISEDNTESSGYAHIPRPVAHGIFSHSSNVQEGVYDHTESKDMEIVTKLVNNALIALGSSVVPDLRERRRIMKRMPQFTFIQMYYLLRFIRMVKKRMRANLLKKQNSEFWKV